MKKISKLNIVFLITALYISQICFGQQSTYTPDLSAINDSTKWGNFDRDVSFDSVVIFNAKASEGANGKIEVERKKSSRPKFCRYCFSSCWQ